VALEQWALAKHCGVVQGIELSHMAGWPAHWVSAHISSLLYNSCLKSDVVSISGLFTDNISVCVYMASISNV